MEYTLNSRSMSGEQRSILFTTGTLNFEKCSSFDITLGHSTCDLRDFCGMVRLCNI